MLGEVVFFRPETGIKLPQLILGFIVEYNNFTSKATISAPFQNSVFYNASYSPDLASPNTWCKKADVVLADKIKDVPAAVAK